MVAQLRYMKSLYFGPLPGKGVTQDLEYAMRTKDGSTPEEEEQLWIYKFLPSVYFVLGSGLGTYVELFGFNKDAAWEITIPQKRRALS